MQFIKEQNKEDEHTNHVKMADLFTEAEHRRLMMSKEKNWQQCKQNREDAAIEQ